MDGERGEMAPVENGIPQGSPVSPILAAFYSAELIEQFQRRRENHVDPSATPTCLFMYVDDGKLYVSSESLEKNVEILKTAYEEANIWMKRVGLAPDVSKRELMHYTRRKRDKTSPHIEFTDDDGVTRKVLAEGTVKWLGVYFDRKLLFNEHVKNMAAKAEKAVSGMSMLANTVRGLSQKHYRQLYIACIRPVLTYASTAWWTGKKTHEKELERVQR